MNYLIDTHIVIFALYDAPQLKPEINTLITDSANTVFVSVVSFWEISIKSNLGKMRVEGLIPENLPHLCEQMGFSVIPLTPQEASTYCRLPSAEHKDPFDRMLVWQALQRGIPLISWDRRLACYQSAGAQIIW
jgi:PIN domain nuclease of toxin-antitoxin system